MFSEAIILETAEQLDICKEIVGQIAKTFAGLSDKVEVERHYSFLVDTLRAHHCLSDDVSVEEKVIRKAVASIHRLGQSLTVWEEIFDRMNLIARRYGSLLEYVSKDPHLMLAALYRSLLGNENRPSKCLSGVDPEEVMVKKLTPDNTTNIADRISCVLTQLPEQVRGKYIIVFSEILGDITEKTAANCLSKTIGGYRTFKSRAIEKVSKLLRSSDES